MDEKQEESVIIELEKGKIEGRKQENVYRFLGVRMPMRQNILFPQNQSKPEKAFKKPIDTERFPIKAHCSA